MILIMHWTQNDSAHIRTNTCAWCSLYLPLPALCSCWRETKRSRPYMRVHRVLNGTLMLFWWPSWDRDLSLNELKQRIVHRIEQNSKYTTNNNKSSFSSSFILFSLSRPNLSTHTVWLLFEWHLIIKLFKIFIIDELITYWETYSTTNTQYGLSV